MDESKFWCAASIHDGEDEFVLNTHLKLREKFKNLITFIIPRHIINTQKIYQNGSNMHKTVINSIILGFKCKVIQNLRSFI